MRTASTHLDERAVRIPADSVILDGDLSIPADAVGIVCFAHGSGSSRHSSRNRFVAGELNRAGLATLLMDLLTGTEESVDVVTRHLRFDIGLLAHRLVGAAEWLRSERATSRLPIGMFGASTGGGAALVAAAQRPTLIGAVVSRGGRPDLAADSLPAVKCPTLLIVGSLDDVVIDLNEEAMARMRAPVRLEIVEGATHLFEEPGTLEQVSSLARDFFLVHLAEPARR